MRDTPGLIASFRMYNAGPRAAAAWNALFARVFADAGVEVEIIEHAWPLPIDDLWRREGLCGGFMCGWPFVRSRERMQAIAAPVPAPARYAGLPRYCSEFLVREDSGCLRIEDTFGRRFGWMAASSQSGFNAPRAHLSQFVSAGRPALFGEVKGPLGTPARALEALRSDEVDVVAIDGFYLDLLRHHDPPRLRGLRCVATTAWTPIPLLVAAPGVSPDAVRRLSELLCGVHERAEYRHLLADACVARFVFPEVSAYRALEDMAQAAERSGYSVIR